MKQSRFLLLAFLLMAFCSFARAQQCYWVYLSDKQGSTFDPYAYFDTKAIERYRLNHADLYHISNYPLSSSYVSQVSALASEVVGHSRWFNAIGVMATPDQIAAIQRLPFVSRTVLIQGHLQPASLPDSLASPSPDSLVLLPQITSLQGQLFRQRGINGKGVRVAVLDTGFPGVDTLPAFKHLFDSNRVVATWNFIRRKENVFTGWNHGTQVLSCLAAFVNDTLLGLATGSEYLLASTEAPGVSPKDEIRWILALEWADKNGADIINSSVGHDDESYLPTQMDGTSQLARAANMAARKGMLICCAAGNNGNNYSWQIVCTPADADSILTVGACQNGNPYSAEALYFSSVGPTADGRLKPNVVAPGQGIYVIDPKEKYIDNDFNIQGTSFASPLVAGFCACALQLNRQLTAMQLKSEIEHSATLYPYYDYDLGYGVPQASYFLGPQEPISPSFHFSSNDTAILIHPQTISSSPHIYLKIQQDSGYILGYYSYNFPDSSMLFSIPKSVLSSHSLHVSYNGFTDSIRLSPDELSRLSSDSTFSPSSSLLPFYLSRDSTIHRLVFDRDTSSYLPEPSKHRLESDVQFDLGFNVFPLVSGYDRPRNALALSYGRHYSLPLSKSYSLSLGVYAGMNNFRFSPSHNNSLDAALLSPPMIADSAQASLRRLRYWQLGLELTQQVRIYSSHPGYCSWHFGLFGEWGGFRYRVRYNNTDPDYDGIITSFVNPSILDAQRLNYGLVT